MWTPSSPWRETGPRRNAAPVRRAAGRDEPTPHRPAVRLTHRAEAGECADAARSGRARPDAARPGAALCCGGCRGLCLPGFPDRPAWDGDGFRRAGRRLRPPAREDGGARAAHTAGPEADLVRRLRRVPRCLSGPCHHDRKRPGAHRPRALHPLLLLSGILPEGRDAGAPHCDRPHCRTLVTAGESLERIRTFCSGSPAASFFRNDKAEGFVHTGPGAFSQGQLVKEVPSGLFCQAAFRIAKLVFVFFFALPLRRVI